MCTSIQHSEGYQNILWRAYLCLQRAIRDLSARGILNARVEILTRESRVRAWVGWTLISQQKHGGIVYPYNAKILS